MTDENETVATFPLGYESRNERHPDLFWLGTFGNRAMVLLDADWRKELSKEEIVNLAAGAWEAINGSPCSRADAELIATGWFAAFERNAELIARAHGSIILPAHHTQQ